MRRQHRYSEPKAAGRRGSERKGSLRGHGGDSSLGSEGTKDSATCPSLRTVEQCPHCSNSIHLSRTTTHPRCTERQREGNCNWHHREFPQQRLHEHSGQPGADAGDRDAARSEPQCARPHPCMGDTVSQSVRRVLRREANWRGLVAGTPACGWAGPHGDFREYIRHLGRSLQAEEASGVAAAGQADAQPVQGLVKADAAGAS